jgi:hypothetical protein
MEDREISLKGPHLSMQHRGEDVRKQPSWKCVTFRASEIRFMKVTHMPKAKPVESTEQEAQNPARRRTCSVGLKRSIHPAPSPPIRK